jgi:hypothetical protein
MFIGSLVGSNFQLDQLPLDNILPDFGRVRELVIGHNLIIFEFVPLDGQTATELVLLSIPSIDFLATLLDYSPWNILIALTSAIIAFVILQRRSELDRNGVLYPQ